MPNKLHMFFDKHKICIICEGNGNIPARYQDRYQNGSYEVVEEVVKFAGDLTKYLNNDIAKYKTLLGFKIQVGACFGSFYSDTAS